MPMRKQFYDPQCAAGSSIGLVHVPHKGGRSWLRTVCGLHFRF